LFAENAHDGSLHFVHSFQATPLHRTARVFNSLHYTHGPAKFIEPLAHLATHKPREASKQFNSLLYMRFISFINHPCFFATRTKGKVYFYLLIFLSAMQEQLFSFAKKQTYSTFFTA
jgi:hypothetical protein